jgi:hypothetical protein
MKQERMGKRMSLKPRVRWIANEIREELGRLLLGGQGRARLGAFDTHPSGVRHAFENVRRRIPRERAQMDDSRSFTDQEHVSRGLPKDAQVGWHHEGIDYGCLVFVENGLGIDQDFGVGHGVVIS